MDYINASVDINTIPRINDVSLLPIHKSYLTILRLQWLIVTVALVIAGSAFIYFNKEIRNNYWWLFISLLIVAISASYFYIQEKSFPFRAFAVREKDVTYQKGWIFRTIMVCPFNRIQNCSVESGPLERRFHLASLIIYTAGTQGADIHISGLLQKEAEKMRHFILDQIHTEINEAV